MLGKQTLLYGKMTLDINTHGHGRKREHLKRRDGRGASLVGERHDSLHPLWVGWELCLVGLQLVAGPLSHGEEAEEGEGCR